MMSIILVPGAATAKQEKAAVGAVKDDAKDQDA